MAASVVRHRNVISSAHLVSEAVSATEKVSL